jgi:hypothetical protein
MPEVHPLRGQEQFGTFLKETIPAFWEKMNHHLGPMWHALYMDFQTKEGRSEIMNFHVESDDPEVAKDHETQAIRAYCQKHNPTALARIGEAYIWELKNLPFVPDKEKMLHDPDYYEMCKSYAQKQEILFVQLETAIGTVHYRWDIIREDGKPPRLGPLVEHADTEGNSDGRYSNLLLRLPE